MSGSDTQSSMETSKFVSSSKDVEDDLLLGSDTEMDNTEKIPMSKSELDERVNETMCKAIGSLDGLSGLTQLLTCINASTSNN